MKEGLLFENDELVFYKQDEPFHAGVIKVDDDIYYIGRGGRAVKGVHIVHGSMANDILKHGTYKFGDDYKLVEGSYIPPVERKSSSSKSRHKSGKSKKKMFSKKGITALSVTAAVVAVLFGVSVILDGYVGNEKAPAASSGVMGEIYLPTFDTEVLLCSDAAKQLYDGEMSFEDAVACGDPYRAFVFDYDLRGKTGELKISEDKDMSNPFVFPLEPQFTSVTVDNLKTGAKYYYEVTVGDEVYTGSFKTAESTRFVKFDGARNTRDIGGYKTQSGLSVKQGMIVRGTEIDGLAESSYYLSDEEVDAALTNFGFVYDLDLRQGTIYSGEYTSRLGSSVGHKFYNAPMYGQIFNKQYEQSVREIFADLAKPQNYPMYLHCTYGTDRTGTIVHLILGALGVAEEDVLHEYRLTAFFSPNYSNTDTIDIVSTGLNGYPGATFGEKVENYLLSIGVTKGEIESIRNILLEK